MTRIIAIASGKGGVGKTTMTANLAAALSKFNKSVIAVDGNLTTSNLGIHLGIPLYPITLQDVIQRKSRVEEAIYFHKSGFRVLPSDVSLTKIINPRSHDFIDLFYKLVGSADIVLIDVAAGLGSEALAVLDAADELITITNPELSAITDALKLGKLAEKMGTKNIGVVINRFKKHPHDIHHLDVKDFLGMNVLGTVREDRKISRATHEKEPIITREPNSRAAQEIMAIAAKIAGVEFKPKTGFFSWLR
ncbi:MAG: cell division ATPase MinD [Candidatus Aenigmatarchaeota archaeon]